MRLCVSAVRTRRSAAHRDLRAAQVVGLLQVQPDLWSRPEIARQPERRVGSDAAVPLQDCGDAVHWHAKRLGQRVGRQVERCEFVTQDLARMHRTHAVLGRHRLLHSLVVIHNFHVVWPVGRPPEADAPLRVDPNAVLPGPDAPERFQSIARQSRQVVERVGAVQQRESAHGLVREPLKRRDPVALEEPPRVSILEASNHQLALTIYVNPHACLVRRSRRPEVDVPDSGSVATFGITRESPLGGPRYTANPNTLWISRV